MNNKIILPLIFLPLILSFVYLPLMFSLFLLSLLLLKLSIAHPIKKPQTPLILLLLILAPIFYPYLPAFIALTSTGEIIFFDALIIILSTTSLPFITLSSKRTPEIAITILLPLAWIIIQLIIYSNSNLMPSPLNLDLFAPTYTIHQSLTNYIT